MMRAACSSGKLRAGTRRAGPRPGADAHTRLPDTNQHWIWSIHADPPLADERMEALLTEIAERIYNELWLTDPAPSSQ